MKILLTGARGQVGSALLRTLPSMGEVVPVDRTTLDLADAEAISHAVGALKPGLIVNAAAYTAVDRAESEEPIARAINVTAPAVLAAEAARVGALLVHFSTDYVFDGTKPSPYVESDVPNPLNVYGRTKLEGEEAVRKAGGRHLILRTSWVYGATGTNFLLTMLRLARIGKPLRVVTDQIGAPTSNLAIAAVVPRLFDAPTGTYHVTSSGHTSWYGFARAIFEATRVEARLTPIPSSEYSTPALRPANSVLDNGKANRLGIKLPPWEQGLREVIQALR